MSLYVQYGCGFCAPDGWVNFDASPTLRLERLPIVGRLVRKNSQRFPANVRPGNIVKGLPITDDTAAGVFASHVLEHLSKADCKTALRNTRRMLKTGGIFRLVVPDLEAIARTYLSNRSADWFMKASGLGMQNGSRIIRAFGNSAHLWMYDLQSMKAALEAAGFSNIRRCSFGDSPDPMFTLVENRERLNGELAIEAT